MYCASSICLCTSLTFYFHVTISNVVWRFSFDLGLTYDAKDAQQMAVRGKCSGGPATSSLCSLAAQTPSWAGRIIGIIRNGLSIIRTKKMISLPPVVAARRNSFEKIFAYELPQFGCALVLQYEICLTIYGVVTGGAPLCEIKGLKIFICTVSSFNCFCSPQRLQFVAVISFFFPSVPFLAKILANTSLFCSTSSKTRKKFTARKGRSTWHSLIRHRKNL